VTYWVDANRVHRFAKVHRGDCTFCNEGRGIHARGDAAVASRWLGPFNSVLEAEREARQTGWDVQFCSFCTPK
jgi:hypothetical protein